MFFVSCLCAIKKNCRKYPIYSCLIFMEHFIKRNKSYNKNNKIYLWSCVSQRSGEASGIQFLLTGNRHIARPFPSSQISTWRKRPSNVPINRQAGKRSLPERPEKLRSVQNVVLCLCLIHGELCKNSDVLESCRSLTKVFLDRLVHP